MSRPATASYGVRYVRSTRKLYLEGESVRDWYAGWGLDRGSGSGFFIPVDIARPIKLASLRRALIDAAGDDAAGGGYWGWVNFKRDASLIIADTSASNFDSKHSPHRDVVLDVVNRTLLVAGNVFLRRGDWDETRVRSTIGPMLLGVKARLADCGGSEDGAFAGNPWPWAFRFEMPIQNKTVGDALHLAEAAIRLLHIADSGELDAQSAWELVRSGRSTVLLGQPESAWLEVKAIDWDLSSDAGKIELAQDLARFANGDSAGLLVVGLATKRREGAHLVHLGPVQHFDASDAQRHHKIIDRRVYPAIEGLSVEAVPSERGGQLLAFWVPAQPPELKPFLVHGAIVGSKVEGSFFSIVRRRGEHSVPVTAEAVHTEIAVGRALLRGDSGKPDL